MLIRSVTSVKKKNAYRVNSSRESFAQNHHIWTDFLVIHSQPSAGSRQARLHLISNPQHLDKTHEHLDLPCESTSQRKKKEKKIISCIHIVCSASRGASLYIQGLCNALHSCTKLNTVCVLSKKTWKFSQRGGRRVLLPGI